MGRIVAALLSGLLLAACTSPEATRVRAGGRGSDVGNVGQVVEMHRGSEPFWGTPDLLPVPGATAAASPRSPDQARDAPAQRR